LLVQQYPSRANLVLEKQIQSKRLYTQQRALVVMTALAVSFALLLSLEHDGRVGSLAESTTCQLAKPMLSLLFRLPLPDPEYRTRQNLGGTFWDILY
jgi:hypothetical protein